MEAGGASTIEGGRVGETRYRRYYATGNTKLDGHCKLPIGTFPQAMLDHWLSLASNHLTRPLGGVEEVGNVTDDHGFQTHPYFPIFNTFPESFDRTTQEGRSSAPRQISRVSEKELALPNEKPFPFLHMVRDILLTQLLYFINHPTALPKEGSAFSHFSKRYRALNPADLEATIKKELDMLELGDIVSSRGTREPLVLVHAQPCHVPLPFSLLFS